MAKHAYLFAGPSAYGTRFEGLEASSEVVPGLTWMPPVRRGDVDSLIQDRSEPGVIAIADGTFHSYPSVSHREIRQAIQQGWVVYGLCSMGAIRVSELRHMGMLPWGTVSRIFCDTPDIPDDEVALIHSSEPPYVPLSEPMIHIRSFLQECLRAQVLSSSQVRLLETSFSRRWYGYRTLPTLHQEATSMQLSADALSAFSTMLGDFERFRIKQRDLESFVQASPWLYTQGPASVAVSR